MVLTKLRITLFFTLAAVGVGVGALVYQTKGKQSTEAQPALTPTESLNQPLGKLPIEEQSAPSANAAPKPPHSDWYGDPLPPGALARLGTIRLRHLGATVMFSPDGKNLLSAGADGTIRHWDTATGQELRRVRVQTAHSQAYPQIFSADGQTAAGTTSQNIGVWDTATGKERRHFPLDKMFAGRDDRWAQVWRLALAPDGKTLAVQFDDAIDRNLHLWDINTGKKIFTRKLRRFLNSLEFSSDGKLLATASNNEGVQLWDTATGKEVRRIAGGQDFLAFSPDGKRVAAVSKGGVKVWNVADGKEVFDVKPAPGRYPNHLTWAPDNKTLAISFPYKGGDSVFYDIAAGKLLRTIPICSGRLAFSPDGKTAATSGPAIQLWDLKTGKEINPRTSHRGMVDSLAIAPDGGSVATFDTGYPFRIWDAASGQPLLKVAAHKSYTRSGAFSPDGRLLVSGGGDTTLRAWDRKTGAEVRKFPIESVKPTPENLQVMALALSCDGERLVSLVIGGDIFHTFQLHVWDFATGKRLARRALKGVGFETRFSPDVRSMANPNGEEVVVSDTITGKELVKASGGMPLAYSPDGQILALAHFNPKPLPPGMMGRTPSDVDAIRLVELATGKQLLRIETGSVGYHLLAYSPDGRTLATIDPDSFRLWDAATGRQLYRRLLPEKGLTPGYSFVRSLAFFPDGDRLATGLTDGTALIWDLEPKTWHAGLAVKDLAFRDLERLWVELAGEDAAKAYRAEWTLAAVPAKAVPFLKNHLHPVSALDAKRVQRLIADLDSPEFTVRDAAEKRLASFAEQAEPALRRALEGKPALEARKRLEALHSEAESAGHNIVHSAELLRTLRAIRVLEHIGDQEAQQVLQKFADGDAVARATRQAKEALQCLQRTATNRPLRIIKEK